MIFVQSLRLVRLGLDVCERGFLLLANVILITMLAINTLNITSRAVFDISLVWVFPWTAFLFVWLTFVTFFVIYRRARDITVDFVVARLGRRLRKAVQLVVSLVTVFVMVVILAEMDRIFASQVGEIEIVGLERYTLSIPLFASCALILINTIVDTIWSIVGTAPKAADTQGT